MAKKQKTRVLVWGDAPNTATGFATVIRNVISEIYKTGEYDIDIIGINYHDGWYDRKKFPYRIIPAQTLGESDPFGRKKLIDVLLGQHTILQPPYDILFTLNDAFQLEPIAKLIAQIRDIYNGDTEDATIDYFGQPVKLEGILPDMGFKWIAYWPVDAALKENWVRSSILCPDYSVSYTEWGKQQIDAFNFDPKTNKQIKKIRTINHGVNTDDFYPISKKKIKRIRKEWSKQLKAFDENTFLISNISRNQPRKDPSRTLKIFKEFKTQVPNSILYLHMKAEDAWGNLREIAPEFNLTEKEDYILPANFSENHGIPLNLLNEIYNISDATLTTTLGEGWGFILTESMATKTPIVAPANTVIPEILDYGKRGWLYKSGVGNSDWFSMGASDTERVRPLGNVDDAVMQLLDIYKNRAEVAEKVNAAYKWVQTISWDKVCKDWVKLFRIARDTN